MIPNVIPTGHTRHLARRMVTWVGESPDRTGADAVIEFGHELPSEQVPALLALLIDADPPRPVDDRPRGGGTAAGLARSAQAAEHRQRPYRFTVQERRDASRRVQAGEDTPELRAARAEYQRWRRDVRDGLVPDEPALIPTGGGA